MINDTDRIVYILVRRHDDGSRIPVSGPLSSVSEHDWMTHPTATECQRIVYNKFGQAMLQDEEAEAKVMCRRHWSSQFGAANAFHKVDGLVWTGTHAEARALAAELRIDAPSTVKYDAVWNRD